MFEVAEVGYGWPEIASPSDLQRLNIANPLPIAWAMPIAKRWHPIGQRAGDLMLHKQRPVVYFGAFAPSRGTTLKYKFGAVFDTPAGQVVKYCHVNHGHAVICRMVPSAPLVVALEVEKISDMFGGCVRVQAEYTGSSLYSCNTMLGLHYDEMHNLDGKPLLVGQVKAAVQAILKERNIASGQRKLEFRLKCTGAKLNARSVLAKA